MNTCWPPPFILRKHRTAKNVNLRVSLPKGLEISVPKYFNLKHIPDVLEKNKDWIVSQLKKLPEVEQTHPELLKLHSLNQEWKIIYLRTSQSKLQLFPRPGHELVIMGDTSNIHQCKSLLVKWLKDYARDFLTSYCEIVSKEINLNWTKLSIRDQKTRWGSCSAEKHISLNYKLLFLPIDLVKYVIIHELCHTIFLNHSKNFWELLASFDKNYKNNRSSLRDVNCFIPAWVMSYA